MQGVTSVMLAGVIAIAMAVAGVRAQDAQHLRPSPNALPAIQAPSVLAQDSSCAGACQTQYDQCRVQTKGNPSCDAARQRCLQACIASKKSR
jgi:hypothetical protein